MRWRARPANASLQIFEDEPVFDRIAAIAKINAERLARFSDFAVVGETRQIGTMGAIELRADDAAIFRRCGRSCIDFFWSAACCCVRGKCSVCAAAVCITADELHQVYDVIERPYGRVLSSTDRRRKI